MFEKLCVIRGKIRIRFRFQTAGFGGLNCQIKQLEQKVSYLAVQTTKSSSLEPAPDSNLSTKGLSQFGEFETDNLWQNNDFTNCTKGLSQFGEFETGNLL